jgi:hypothetical protein
VREGWWFAENAIFIPPIMRQLKSRRFVTKANIHPIQASRSSLHIPKRYIPNFKWIWRFFCWAMLQNTLLFLITKPFNLVYHCLTILYSYGNCVTFQTMELDNSTWVHVAANKCANFSSNPLFSNNSHKNFL